MNFAARCQRAKVIGLLAQQHGSEASNYMVKCAEISLDRFAPVAPSLADQTPPRFSSFQKSHNGCHFGERCTTFWHELQNALPSKYVGLVSQSVCSFISHTVFFTSPADQKVAHVRYSMSNLSSYVSKHIGETGFVVFSICHCDG